MLQIIRNNNPFTVLILFIFCLLLKLPVLLHPVVPVAEVSLPAYNVLIRILSVILFRSAFAFTLLSVVLIFLQALILNGLTQRFRLYTKPTYIPAYCYILLTCLLPDYNYFNPILCINFLLLLSFSTIFNFAQPLHPRKFIFNAGFLLGCCALFQFSTIAFIILLIMGLILLRSFNVGEWTVAFMGAITVIYFYFSILYLTDNLSVIKEWATFGLSIPRQVAHPVYLYGIVGGLALMTVSGLVVLQGVMNKSTINNRRNWGVITSSLLTTCIAAVITPKTTTSAWLMIMIPLALIIAHPLYIEKNKRFSNFIFYFSLLLLIFSQIAFNK